MSGVVKSIGKVFKKIAKVVKKILPIVLAVGAIVFTGGAALGLGGIFAGGFAGAVSTGLSAIGISSTGVLGTILSGAITQAGVGAAIGGSVSAATGGSFAKGAAVGAVTGAITGTATGVFNVGKSIIGQVGTKAPNLTGIKPPLRPANLGQATQATGLIPNVSTVGKAAANVSSVSSAPVQVAQNVGQVAPKTGLLGNIGGFLKTESGGKLLAGVGTGLLQGIGASKADEERIAFLREQDDRVIGSFEGAGNSLRFASGDGGQRKRPAFERYLDRKNAEQPAPPQRRFTYDRATGQIQQTDTTTPITDGQVLPA